MRAERDAAPAGVARNHVLGRLRGSARAALRPLCEELAELARGLFRVQEARPGAEKCRKQSSLRRLRKLVCGWSAERRVSVSQTETARLQAVRFAQARTCLRRVRRLRRPPKGASHAPCVSRRSASPHWESVETTMGEPGAATTGRRSIVFCIAGCLKIESVKMRPLSTSPRRGEVDRASRGRVRGCSVFRRCA